MGQIIEIIFEDLEADGQYKIFEEIRHLIPRNSFLNADEDAFKLNQITPELMLSLQSRNENYSLTIDPKFLDLDSVLIRFPRISFVKYDGSKLDININFEIELVKSISKSQVIQSLHNFAIKLAKKNYVKTYFCGLDPAVDENTRFFTNEKLGPYFFPT